MTFRSTDFRTCYGFRRRARARLGSGVRHDHERSPELPLGPRRHSLHLLVSRGRIGSALPRDFPGFADFDGIRPGVSHLPLNFKSVASTNFAIGAKRAVYLGSLAGARGVRKDSGPLKERVLRR